MYSFFRQLIFVSFSVIFDFVDAKLYHLNKNKIASLPKSAIVFLTAASIGVRSGGSGGGGTGPSWL